MAIKKDIAYNVTQNKDKSVYVDKPILMKNKDEFVVDKTKLLQSDIGASEDVDSIFEEADKLMFEKQQSLVGVVKDKKKRKHGFLKMLLGILLIAIVTIVTISYLFIQEAKEKYPSMKENFLSQINIAYNELLSIDDDELTDEQRYQKQLLMLMTPEEIEIAINDLEDVEVLLNIIFGNIDLTMEILPEGKREEYEQLVQEYKEYLDQQSTAPSNDQLLETESEQPSETNELVD